MGNKNASCLRPQIEDSNFDTNSEFKIINNPEHKNRRMPKCEDIRSYSNKSISFNSRKNFYSQNSPTYLDKVKTIQKYVRFCLSVKKFNEHIDLLTNILELDSTVNVIKDKKIANNLLKNNIGEQLSIQLINNKKIIDSSYNDVGTPIQEGLEDIEKLKFNITFIIFYSIINKDRFFSIFIFF